MGQGLFNQVVFGQLEQPKFRRYDDGDLWREEFDLLCTNPDIRLEVAYNAEPDYIGVVVCSELAEGGEEGLVVPYQALSLAAFVNAIEEPRPYLEERQEAWEMFRCAMREKYGVEFEAGQLLWISDYD